MISVYSIRLLKPASKELGKLDKTTAQRIVERLHWLSSNIHSSNIGKIGEIREWLLKQLKK